MCVFWKPEAIHQKEEDDELCFFMFNLLAELPLKRYNTPNPFKLWHVSCEDRSMETAPTFSFPLSVFISFANEDENLLREFEKHLNMLKRRKIIQPWHHRNIHAGMNKQQEIDEHLSSASLILLLISPDFFNSDDCEREMQQALAYCETNKTLVIPILLRSTMLKDTPCEPLVCLPRDDEKSSLDLWENRDVAWTNIVEEIDDTIHKYSLPQNKQLSDKEKRLRILIPDHNGFLKDRLESFVGRQQELAEIQNLIHKRLPTGGYITITGQAGQGKSSIIAKLIETYGVEQVAYHFIPINPGPDHQVGLLRNLMARLILKYDLSELYVASDNRAALRDYFPKVLTDVANQGGQEIIFLDGLDQLEEDFNGVRDLSFLPTNPPSGIVFVLGTRPNDTMKPLELLKPHNEYRLPNLSRQDFDRILLHRNVSLKETIADQFYNIMRENALYLDLVAKELMASDALEPLAIIARITANPNNIFTLSLERLKRQEQLWERVIYPVLGVLLTVQEPLSLPCIRDILQVEDYKLRDGMVRLGGLLTEDTQRRYSLFHLKLRDYLRQDTETPQKEYIFTIEEEEGWHAQLAAWCERGQLLQIWQDTNNLIEQGRRIYARQHYITHLYYAHQWQQLFDILDEGSYGHAKERYDVTTHSYVQDLDRGCQAASKSSIAIEDAIVMLPRHWRYMLLRSSLRSRADQYPIEMFQLLLLLRREKEVLGLAELLTKPCHKVEVLLLIAKHIAKQPGREAEYAQLFFRASDVAYAIEQKAERTWALSMLVSALADVEQWKQAEAAAHAIEGSDERTWALSMLVSALADASQWKQAEAAAHTIEGSNERIWALSTIASALAKAGQWEQAKRFWTEADAAVHAITEDDERSWMLSILANALAKAGQWEQAKRLWDKEKGDEQAKTLREQVNVLAGTKQWEQAEALARTIEENDEQVRALSVLATSLAKVGQWEQAKRLWAETEAVVHTIEEISQRIRMLSVLASALAKAGQWEQAKRLWTEAEAVAYAIKEVDQRIQMLIMLANMLITDQQRGRAEMICIEIERIISLIEKDNEQDRALNALVDALAKAGQWEQAKVVVYTIENISQRARALNALAGALVEGGQWEQAKRFWAAAKAAADLLKGSNERERGKVLGEFAKTLVKTEQWEQSIQLWAEIRTHINWRYGLSEMPKELVKAFIKTGQWDQAEVFVKAEQWERNKIMPSYKRKSEHAEVLNLLASNLAEIGQWERAMQLWVEAKTIAHTIERNDEQVGVLNVLASTLTKAGQWEQAMQLWVEAKTIAHTIERNDEQAVLLNTLANALAEAGQWEQAMQLWTEAKSITYTLEESYKRAEILSTQASALAKAGQWEQATQLWIEAEAIVQTIQRKDKLIDVLKVLASDLLIARQYQSAISLIHFLWLQIEIRNDAFLFFPLALGLLPLQPEIGEAFYQGFQWVDAFLNG